MLFRSRILAGGDRRRPRAAAVLLGLAAALFVLGIVMLVLPGSAFAASPTPSAMTGSDTRSAGEGPGLVGAPPVALLGVVGIGLAAALLTIGFVRVTGGPGERPNPAGRDGPEGPRGIV